MSFTTLEIISALKDIVLAIAAIITATVAIIGLSTWDRQLRGTAGFEAARALSKSAYKVRDTLQDCRSPLLSSHEFPPEYHEGRSKQSSEKEAKGYAFLYTNRWSSVWQAMQEFDANLLEAEALWGQFIRTATDPLRKVVLEVNIAIDSIIVNAASGGEVFASDIDFGKKMRSTVSAVRTDSKNEINIKLAAAVQSIDDQLRPHLERS
jgi:hypothetical protein